MSTRPAILAATLLAGAWARPAGVAPLLGTTDAQIAAAIGRCGLRGQIGVHVEADGVRIVRLDPNARYESVDCFLRAVGPLGAR